MLTKMMHCLWEAKDRLPRPRLLLEEGRDPYSGKKLRSQSEAPDTLQLALDIAAALAKGKDATNTLPAPTVTGNINLVGPAGAADADVGAGADPAGKAAPSTPPSLG